LTSRSWRRMASVTRIIGLFPKCNSVAGSVALCRRVSRADLQRVRSAASPCRVRCTRNARDT
jgi:hypothetical protein